MWPHVAPPSPQPQLPPPACPPPPPPHHGREDKGRNSDHTWSNCALCQGRSIFEGDFLPCLKFFHKHWLPLGWTSVGLGVPERCWATKLASLLFDVYVFKEDSSVCPPSHPPSPPPPPPSPRTSLNSKQKQKYNAHFHSTLPFCVLDRRLRVSVFRRDWRGSGRNSRYVNPHGAKGQRTEGEKKKKKTRTEQTLQHWCSYYLRLA